MRTNESLSFCSHLWPLLLQICWQRSFWPTYLTRAGLTTTNTVARHQYSWRRPSVVTAPQLRSTKLKCNARYKSFFAGNCRTPYSRAAKLSIQVEWTLQLFHLSPSLDKVFRNSSYHSKLSTRPQKKLTLNSSSSSLCDQVQTKTKRVWRRSSMQSSTAWPSSAYQPS